MRGDVISEAELYMISLHQLRYFETNRYDSVCQINVLMPQLTNCVLTGLEFLLMLISAAYPLCVYPKYVITVASICMCLPKFILEVIKQCVTLWF